MRPHADQLHHLRRRIVQRQRLDLGAMVVLRQIGREQMVLSFQMRDVRLPQPSPGD